MNESKIILECEEPKHMSEERTIIMGSNKDDVKYQSEGEERTIIMGSNKNK